MRILHLIQPHHAPDHWLFAPRPGASGEASLHFLRDVLSDLSTVPSSHVAVVLGGTASRQLAESVGLRDFIHIAPPLARSSLAGPSLRALLPRLGRLDAVVAWGKSAAEAQSKIPRRPETAHLTVGVATGQVSLSDADAESRTITLPWNTSTRQTRRAKQSTSAQRSRLRQQFSIPDDELCVLVMSDDACPTLAPECLLALSSLAVCRNHASILLPRSSHDFTRALRTAHDGGFVHRLIPTTPDHSMKSLLAAADIALVAPHEHAMPGLKDADELMRPILPSARFWLEATRAGIPAILPNAIAHRMNIEHAPCIARSVHATDLSRALLPLLESKKARTDAAHSAAAAANPSPNSPNAPMSANEALIRSIEHLRVTHVQTR